MKNIFSQNIKTKEFNNAQFVIRKADQSLIEQNEEIAKEALELKKKKLPPAWLVRVALVLTMLAFYMIIAFLTREEGFLKALEKVGFLFYIAAAIFILSIIFIIFYVVKVRNINQDEEVKELKVKADNQIRQMLFELEVPDTSIQVDVLASYFKINKRGEEVQYTYFGGNFININMSLFIEDNNLCFSNLHSVIAIPLSDLKEATKIKRRIIIPNRNKDVRFNDEKYKKYKIYREKSTYSCLNYYEIRFVHNDEEFFFALPSYDFDEFFKIINNEIPVIG